MKHEAFLLLFAHAVQEGLVDKNWDVDCRGQLTPYERYVVCWRARGLTFKQIGERLSTTRGVVTRIYKKALLRLQSRLRVDDNGREICVH